MDVASEIVDEMFGKNGSSEAPASDDEDEKVFGVFHDEHFLNNRNLFDRWRPASSSCKMLLCSTLGEGSRTRVWDVLVLVPDLLFLLFLFVRLRRSIGHLSSTNAPAMAALHHMVSVSALVGLVRCVLSIFASNVLSGEAEGEAATAADKLLWVALEFFLLSTEISVLCFVVFAAAVVDSKALVLRMVFVSASVSLAFCLAQLSLEFALPHPAFMLHKEDGGGGGFSAFGHGGGAFLCAASTTIAFVYGSVTLLPFLPFCPSLVLPHKRPFLYYGGFMLVLNAIQAVGSGMTESGSGTVTDMGLCLVNTTTYVYYVAFLPVVYFTFLTRFFDSQLAQPEFLFSYRAQMDEMDDETVAADRRSNGMSLTSSSASGDPSAEDLLAQEQNTPIIISGAL